MNVVWKRLAKGAASLAVASALIFGGSTAANAAGSPSNLSVKFNSSTMTLSWAAAPGASSYTVIVSKKGYSGPYTGYTTTGTTLNLAYKNFPYRTSAGSGYTFTVKAANGGSVSTTKSIKLNTQGSKLAAKGKSWATIAAKINKCLNDGGVAAAAAGATTGAVAVASIWVPGVNAVTAGGAAAAIGGSFATGTLICSITTKW